MSPQLYPAPSAMQLPVMQAERLACENLEPPGGPGLGGLPPWGWTPNMLPDKNGWFWSQIWLRCNFPPPTVPRIQLAPSQKGWGPQTTQRTSEQTSVATWDDQFVGRKGLVYGTTRQVKHRPGQSSFSLHLCLHALQGAAGNRMV